MATFHATGRFYEDDFPEIEDLVVVQIVKIDDKAGCYVTLLEYDSKEAMINIGEVSKRRIRSLAKLLRVGSTEVCLVVDVDREKGYINLSKKRVTTEDCPPMMDKFAKAKAIHGVMQHVAQSNNIPVEELCNKVAWPLNAEFTFALDAFKQHINGELDAWKHCDFSQPGLDLSEMADKLKKDIETVLQRRLLASVVRLQAKCEVSCDGYEGIDAVKEALMEGFSANKEDHEVNIKLIAHPVFALSCMCRDKEIGMKVLDEALAIIEKSILGRGGAYSLKSKPTFITDKEDGKDKNDDESGSDSGGESSSSEDPDKQDDTMGNFNADFSDVMKKKVEAGDDSD